VYLKVQDNRAKAIAFTALMIALSNILSAPPFVIPVVVGALNSNIHLTQIPILLSGILAGPWVGLMTGALGGLYMGFSSEMPFVVGGLAILGFASGILANRRKIKPIYSGILAWSIQAPYVFFTDYLWFIYSRAMPPPVALSTVMVVMLKLTIEALIASALSAVIVSYVKRHLAGWIKF
jgi:LytS/YehU family sensor histidine kinase